MLEWIWFFVVAALLISALVSFAIGVIGVYRFGFVMNRMHAGGIGDTFGIFCLSAALMVGTGANMDTLKIALIVVFMWFTSPVSTHFLSQIEYYTNRKLDEHMDRKGLDDSARIL